MAQLVVATKAAPLAWSPLLLTSYIGEANAQGNIKTTYNPAATVDKSKETVSLTYGSSTFHGTTDVLRALARIYKDTGVYGKDALTSTLIDEWVDFADKLSKTTDGPTLISLFEKLDSHMILRTFVVGHKMTLADIAVWGALKGTPRFVGSMKLDTYSYVNRWYTHIESLEFVKSALAAQKSSLQAANKGPASTAYELGLENAVDGQVVTRFPPEPSGYLHIGHAKAALLNNYFAKHYHGKMLIRFDDTNPSKEKQEYQDAIIEDLALMEIKPDKMSYTSDYFDELYRYAIQMIKNGLAYADDTEQEQMRAERMDGIDGKNRNMSIEDTLAKFAIMTEGTEEGLRWCLRAKIGMQIPNKAMRDPVIYRCNPLPHHRTGSTWKVYPTYDFACPIVDSIEGVTHALRTNEYRDRNPQYQWMIDSLKLRGVNIWDFSRLNFIYTFLSKRKLSWLVDQGRVTGWDDPRFPTIRGVRRRGLTVEALRSFILSLGPTQNVLNMEWDSIWAANKKVIDPVAPRHTGIEVDHIVKISLKSAPASETKAMPKHKKNPDVGTKQTVFAPEVYVEQVDAAVFADNEEITLMDWGNAFVRAKHPSAKDAKVIDSIDGELHLEGDFKKTDKKVTWLAAEPKAIIPALLLDYDYLITKKVLEKTDEPLDYLTPVTEFVKQAIVDVNVKSYKTGDIIQLERKGYYIVDKASGEAPRKRSAEATTKAEEIAKMYGLTHADVVELIHIPDGKQASLASKADTSKGGNDKRKAESKKKGNDAGKKEAENGKQAKAEKAQKGATVGAATAGAAVAATAAVAASAAATRDAPKAAQSARSAASTDVPGSFETPVDTKMFATTKHGGDVPLDHPSKVSKMFVSKNPYV